MKTMRTKKTQLDQFDSVLFRKHIKQFCESHNLLSFTKPEAKILLSVSGGVDSMALMDIFFHLLPACEVLHFNHGTRGQENLKEQKLISDLCEKNNIQFHHITFSSLNLDQSNFEHQARLLRQKEYIRFVKMGYIVVTGHHLNDSFEWSLMQSFKQSQLDSTLGIPVYSKGIIRPLLCVSKNQLLKYALKQKLTWIEDTSNLNQKFERNSFRQSLEVKIAKRYPQYLKHYVSKSNELAFLLGVHRLCLNNDSKEINQTSSSNDLIRQDAFGGVCLMEKPDLKNKNKYKKWIYHFSQASRGTIDTELERVLKSIEVEKQKEKHFVFKGPIDFSGGAKVIFFPNYLYFFNQSILLDWQSYDSQLLERLKEAKATQIPDMIHFNDFPFLTSHNRKLSLRKVKWVHPLLRVTIKWLKEQEIPYTFTQL